jgi:hypothetical protein
MDANGAGLPEEHRTERRFRLPGMKNMISERWLSLGSCRLKVRMPNTKAKTPLGTGLFTLEKTVRDADVCPAREPLASSLDVRIAHHLCALRISLVGF